MKPETARQLIEINRRFYTAQAGVFAETRRRIQPGTARVLAGLPDIPEAEWLDLGCGSGWLAVEWLRAGRKSAYTGLDFSPFLLEEAGREVKAAFPHASTIAFSEIDFSAPDWAAGLRAEGYAGVLCFAVVHHLPGWANRLDFLRKAAGLIQPGGMLWLSVWQFQNSAKLAARQIPWQRTGLDTTDLEPGDTLLDWRRTADGVPALRYVHRFEPGDLAALVQAAGLQVGETFESDGAGGRLGLYLGCHP